MDKIVRIGMDTSKNVFQLHGVNEEEEPVLRRKLRRAQMGSLLSRLSPTIVGIEAGRSSAPLGTYVYGDGPRGQDHGPAVRRTVCQARQE